MATIGTLQRLSAASLSKLLLAAQEAAAAGDPTIAIIDVRDDGTSHVTRPLHACSLPYQTPFPVYPITFSRFSLPHPFLLRHHPSNHLSLHSVPLPSPSPTLASSPPPNPCTDYIGGHIRGSQNVPSRTLDAMLPTLVRQLRDKQTVVFHCALSQQRGPSAALRYLRERERVLAAEEGKRGKDGGQGGKGEGKVDGEEKVEVGQGQEVYVLDQGFVGWQEVYGTDERLTEGYRKELWADGYWG